MKKIFSLLLILVLITGCTPSSNVKEITNKDLKISFEVPKSWEIVADSNERMLCEGGEIGTTTKSFIYFMDIPVITELNKEVAFNILKTDLSNSDLESVKTGTTKTNIGEFAYIEYNTSLDGGDKDIAAYTKRYLLLDNDNPISIMSVEDTAYQEDLKASEVIKTIIETMKSTK